MGFYFSDWKDGEGYSNNKDALISLTSLAIEKIKNYQDKAKTDSEFFDSLNGIDDLDFDALYYIINSL
jgi:uncharacterized protein with NAD-binding domain and iron-sulfur cluster